MAIFSLPSCLFGLALAVYLPERIWQSPTCFLDAVSIHQTDQGLMKQGVYGLGGFLKASKELRILWSAPYFSRRGKRGKRGKRGERGEVSKTSASTRLGGWGE